MITNLRKKKKVKVKIFNLFHVKDISYKQYVFSTNKNFNKYIYICTHKNV